MVPLVSLSGWDVSVLAFVTIFLTFGRMAETEKSLGKRLLGFFIKEEESSPRVSTTETQRAHPTVSGTASASVSNSAGTADVDRKFVEHFVALLEKANQPGPDYFEFKQALKSMDGLGLDEAKKFQASWASFKAMAGPPGGAAEISVLTASANQYISILDRDRTGFLKDVEKALNERVGSLTQELSRLQEENKVHAQQIMELQKKINANNERLGQINGEIQEQSVRINDSRDSYDITYHSFVEQINSDVAKINQYLK